MHLTAGTAGFINITALTLVRSEQKLELLIRILDNNDKVKSTKLVFNGKTRHELYCTDRENKFPPAWERVESCVPGCWRDHVTCAAPARAALVTSVPVRKWCWPVEREYKIRNSKHSCLQWSQHKLRCFCSYQ